MVCIVYVRFELIAHRFIKWNKKNSSWHPLVSDNKRSLSWRKSSFLRTTNQTQKILPILIVIIGFGIRLKSVRSLVSKQRKPSACIWCMEMMLAKVNNTEKKSALTTLAVGNLTLSLSVNRPIFIAHGTHISFALSIRSLFLHLYRSLPFILCSMWKMYDFNFSVWLNQKRAYQFYHLSIVNVHGVERQTTHTCIAGELIYQNQTCLTRFIRIRNWFFFSELSIVWSNYHRLCLCLCLWKQTKSRSRIKMCIAEISVVEHSSAPTTFLFFSAIPIHFNL